MKLEVKLSSMYILYFYYIEFYKIYQYNHWIEENRMMLHLSKDSNYRGIIIQKWIK